MTEECTYDHICCKCSRRWTHTGNDDGKCYILVSRIDVDGGIIDLNEHIRCVECDAFNTRATGERFIDDFDTWAGREYTIEESFRSIQPS